MPFIMELKMVEMEQGLFMCLLQEMVELMMIIVILMVIPIVFLQLL